MKPILTVESVQAAMDALAFREAKITLQSIHAELGNRGSITTVMRLKQQIESQNANTPQNLRSFEIYKHLRSQLRDELQLEIYAEKQELRDSLDAATAHCRELTDENNRLSSEIKRYESKCKLLDERNETLSEQINATYAQINRERDHLNQLTLKWHDTFKAIGAPNPST